MDSPSVTLHVTLTEVLYEDLEAMRRQRGHRSLSETIRELILEGKAIRRTRA